MIEHPIPYAARAGYASSGPVSAAFAKLTAINYATKVGRGEIKASEELFR